MLKSKKDYKMMFREPVPDAKRRDLILQLFNINSVKCQAQYEVILKEAGEDFIEHVKTNSKAKISLLDYDFLNEEGRHQHEIILALLIKERLIKHSPFMTVVASMLLIYLKPFEVYFVLSEMIKSSQEAHLDPNQA